MPNHKRSRQRDAILNELMARTDHPTAEELYFSLKNDMPNLSLGTVYRNLNTLSSDGVILKLSGDGADHFDGNINQHYHLYCLKCGRVSDIEMPIIEEIESQAKMYKNGVLSSYSLSFRGTCENCLE